jgi:hypothetical protein
MAGNGESGTTTEIGTAAGRVIRPELGRVGAGARGLCRADWWCSSYSWEFQAVTVIFRTADWGVGRMTEPTARSAGRELLVAEEIFLLVTNNERGTSSGVLGVDQGIAGALLFELAMAGRLGYEGNKFVLGETASADHPLLHEVLERVRAEEKPRSAKWWVQRLPRQLKPLRVKVGQNLVERGVVSEKRRRVLGLFSMTRFPVYDPAPELSLRERLRQVLLAERDPEARDAFIVAVIRAQRRIGTLVPKDARKQAENRAKQITEGDLLGKAVGDSIKEIQAAIIAGTMAATIAATSAGSGAGG